MKDIILANAPINNGNRGCVALTYCSIILIDKILGRGNYKLYLTNSQQNDGKYSISIGGELITYESVTLPQLLSLSGMIKSVARLNRTIQALSLFRRIDCIFDIGQGDSFADIYGKARFEQIDYIHRVARILKKPYVFLPQTIGPFGDASLLSKAKKSIKNALSVMVRDKMSYDYARCECPSQLKINEIIDVAFFLPYNKIEFEREYIKVGINISALLWNGGYSGNNQFGLACDYQKLNKDLIDYFLHQPKTKVYLIPHVVMQERNVENDYEVAYDLWREFSNPNLMIAPFALDPIEIKSFISGLDFFMGARMHATIAAFSTGVPVIPFAYSRKFNGLYRNTLNYDYVADMKEMNNTSIIQMVKKSFDSRQQIRTCILDRQKKIVENRCSIMIAEMESILKSL